MKADNTLDTTGLDALIQADSPFFLYRRPGMHPWVLAVFTPSSLHRLSNLGELNNRQGFVLAPFNRSATHPLLLLTNPTLYEGEEAIKAYLKGVNAGNQPTNGEADTVTRVEAAAGKTDTPPLEPETDKKAYHVAYETCLDAINSGLCQKIVLSRQEKYPRPVGFSAALFFSKACAAYPEAFVYLCHTSLTGTWLGSSPEQLLESRGNEWTTVALAGTRAGSRKGLAGWDTKNLDEQRIVSYHVEAVLDSFARSTVKEGPVSSRAGGLTHLKTTYRFSLPEKLTGKMGDLLASLHPTPATCGWPTTEALSVLERCEKHSRAYYAGFLGPLQVEGLTALYVNLRCMHIETDKLTLFAGGGLLADSTVTAEWAETTLKLQTLVSLMD